MLPTRPQSIFELFFGSLKAYKKVFVPILPIVAMLFVTPFLLPGIGFLLLIFGVCWETCFIYNILAKQEIAYKATLITTAKKTLQILALIFLTLIPVMLVTSLLISLFTFGVISTELYQQHKIVSIILAVIALVTIYLLPFYFFFFSFLELIINKTGLWSATKKVAKILFKIGSIWRILCLHLLFVAFFSFVMILIALLFLPVKILSGALGWLVSIPLDAFIWVFSALIGSIIFSLICTADIYLYNDLVLRFRGRRQ